MDLGITDKVRPLREKVRKMIQEEIMPLDEEYHAEVGKTGNRFEFTDRQTEIREGLKDKAKAAGLWKRTSFSSSVVGMFKLRGSDLAWRSNSKVGCGW